MKVSIIIPVFNEEKVISDCLNSLADQSYQDLEILIVDDGSTDKTLEVLSTFKVKTLEIRILQQKHLGPAKARNLGAENSNGDILVFVDSDMTFNKDFIKKLVKPILDKQAIGTFSKDERVLNKDNFWSQCWNINKGLPIDLMHPKDYPDSQPVFRAVLKKEFDGVGGFTSIGYIDDYTLSEKLGVLAINAPGAIFYHRNPETLTEVYSQARWVGKSEYKKRKIKNEQIMRLISIIRYSLPFSLFFGLKRSLEYRKLGFIFFKIIYDFAIEVSLLKSVFGEQLYR